MFFIRYSKRLLSSSDLNFRSPTQILELETGVNHRGNDGKIPLDVSGSLLLKKDDATKVSARASAENGKPVLLTAKRYKDRWRAIVGIVEIRGLHNELSELIRAQEK